MERRACGRAVTVSSGAGLSLTTVSASEATPGVYWYPGKLGNTGGIGLYTSEFFSGRVSPKASPQHGAVER